MPDPNPVARRRTFAIISHPDAGKTTLTEKMLLFGGAIQLAGEVRAKANRRKTRSDWMGIERERGISVVTSVMTFETAGCVFNLLDTPGHEDFSEDTYRTLTAVDSAVMVIDAAKGIEARTRKLFEVCRLRDIPIVTFINKMDRETRDPFDLIDEIEKTLALDAAPLNWTIGRGRSLAGAYDIRAKRLIPFGPDAEPIAVAGPDDPRVAALLPEHERAQAIDELNLAIEGLKRFDKQAFLEGHMTPVLFGSALKDFGVKELIDALAEFAPSPRAQAAASRTVKADEGKMTGFVFKIQANMDPNHRDRIAFLRVCSGQLKRGMRAKLVRTGKPVTLHGAAILLRPGSLAGGGGVRRRRRRHSQSRAVAHRRYVERGRGDRLSRRAELRSGNPAPGQACRRDEGQEAARGAAADGGRGRRAGVPAAGRRGGDRRRRRGAAARCADRAAQRRIRPPRDLRAEPLRDLPLGFTATRRNSRSSSTPIRRPSLRTSTARRCSWRRAPSTCATSRSAGRRSPSRTSRTTRRRRLSALGFGRPTS